MLTQLCQRLQLLAIWVLQQPLQWAVILWALLLLHQQPMLLQLQSQTLALHQQPTYLPLQLWMLQQHQPAKTQPHLRMAQAYRQPAACLRNSLKVAKNRLQGRFFVTLNTTNLNLL
jgi:hypothetical protein